MNQVCCEDRFLLSPQVQAMGGVIVLFQYEATSGRLCIVLFQCPRPNETQVSLNADSGDNETKFHFNVLGSSGCVDMLWRDYRRARGENE